MDRGNLRESLSKFVGKPNLTELDVRQIESICNSYISNCGFSIFFDVCVGGNKIQRSVLKSLAIEAKVDKLANVRSVTVIPNK